MWGHPYYSYSHTSPFFSCAAYGVVTIVFPNLLLYFLLTLFFVHPVQLLTAPNKLYSPCGHQKLSDALRCVSGCEVIAIRLMLKTAPRRSQRAILLLSHTICITIIFSSAMMPMNALKPSTSSSRPGKCLDIAKS